MSEKNPLDCSLDDFKTMFEDCDEEEFNIYLLDHLEIFLPISHLIELGIESDENFLHEFLNSIIYKNNKRF